MIEHASIPSFWPCETKASYQRNMVEGWLFCWFGHHGLVNTSVHIHAYFIFCLKVACEQSYYVEKCHTKAVEFL